MRAKAASRGPTRAPARASKWLPDARVDVHDCRPSLRTRSAHRERAARKLDLSAETWKIRRRGERLLERPYSAGSHERAHDARRPIPGSPTAIRSPSTSKLPLPLSVPRFCCSSHADCALTAGAWSTSSDSPKRAIFRPSQAPTTSYVYDDSPSQSTSSRVTRSGSSSCGQWPALSSRTTFARGIALSQRSS